MQRPKPPVSIWIAAERKRHGWKVEELSRRLIDAGYPAEVSTVRVWEAGRTPAAATTTALERLFGSAAPVGQPLGQELNPASVEAIKALTAAAQAQADAMQAIAEEMRLARAADQARAEGLAVALGDLASTLERLRLAPAGGSAE